MKWSEQLAKFPRLTQEQRDAIDAIIERHLVALSWDYRPLDDGLFSVNQDLDELVQENEVPIPAQMASPRYREISNLEEELSAIPYPYTSMTDKCIANAIQEQIQKLREVVC